MFEEQQTQETSPEALPPMPDNSGGPEAEKPAARGLSPGDRVTLSVYNHAGAGSTVGTRWGPVLFDSDGLGEVNLVAQDIVLLDQLKWLLPEDRAKYLGVAVRATRKVASDNAAEMANAKLATLIAENVELVNANEKGREQLEALLTRLEVLEGAESGFNAKMDALNKENASLKTSLAKAKDKGKGKGKGRGKDKA